MTGLLLFLAAPAAPARADAQRDAEWHLGFLDMARVGQVSQGDGVTVAVIDDGINGNHPDLIGNVLHGVSVLPGHPGDGWEDVDPHGTAMAGLIAAHGHNGGRDGIVGIAPKAEILPIQIGSGKDLGDPDTIPAGIDAAVQHGARVISMSFGGAESAALQAAVTRAQRADVVLVAGVGNKPEFTGVTWPARYDGVVAVAAVDRNGNHADFSVTGRQVLVAAPGADIKSTLTHDGYGTGSGTSNATAITAGVVALIRSKYPTLSATEVIHRLTATATDKGPQGRDDEYGYGIINPYAALIADIPPLTASTTPTGTPPSTPEAQPPTKKTSPVPIVIAAIAATAVLVAVLLVLARRRTR